jgi:hypothetical protein
MVAKEEKQMWLHAHVGLWSLALILFVIGYIGLKAGWTTFLKIVQMVLRLVFVLVFITGARLVFIWYQAGNYGWPTVKGLFGLLVIAMMEMILTRGRKNEKTGVFWVLLLVGLIAVFYIGYGVLG